jgi:hypothetical protein
MSDAATHDELWDGSIFRPDPDSKCFGQSATCRRMVRKNKLRRLGIAGQRQ